MKRQIQAGKTDYSVLVFIPDPASTDGSGKTGLVAADLTVSGTRVETDNDVVITDYTSSLSNLSALTDTHADWGLKEVSNTLAPGLYRLDIADAIFASGAWTAVVYVMITSSAAAASPMEFVLVTHDPDDLGTKQSGDSYAIVNSGTHGNAAIKGYVDDIGTAGAGLTAIPWNAAWDTEVESECNDALVGQNLDHLVKIAVDTNFATTVHADSVVGQIADNGAGYDRTTDSLEALRDRGDAAWTTATGFSTHSAADVWAVATRILTAGTNIVLAKGVGVTGFNDLSAAQVNAEADTALADYDAPTNTEMVARTLAAADYATATALDAVDNFLDTEIADIKTKTDLIPADPADASDIAASFGTVNSTLATIAGYIDTEVASILAAVDTEVTTANAALVKIQAAVYDTLTSNGTNILTLSNAKTQTFDDDGNRTTSA